MQLSPVNANRLIQSGFAVGLRRDQSGVLVKAILWRPQVVDQAERRRLSAAMSGGVPRPVPLNDFLEAYKRYKPKMWVEAPETVKTKGLLGKTVGLPHHAHWATCCH